MSSSASSCNSSRGAPPPPSTPDTARPAVTRAASYSLAPKSEYLRNALQARRAQPTPTPSTSDMRPPLPPGPSPTKIKTPTTSLDVFAEFALTEEHTTPVSPIRRRRPSEPGPPRTKTNRELTNELGKLKDSLMTTNMRVELLKKSNSDLQHEITNAKERVEELEPLEDENYELQDENHHLGVKIANLEAENARLLDANDDIRESNENLLKSRAELSAMADQNAALWQSQESALDEAVEYIVSLEGDKALLSSELKELKERVAALEISPTTTMLVDGTPRYPSRIQSVDESRPSTSHFDSDYYSQTDSPRVKPSNASDISFTPSERSRKLLDSAEDHKRSARDLVKRMSAASLKAKSIMSPSPPPTIPEIPDVYKEHVRYTLDNNKFAAPPRTPGRYRKSRQLVSRSLLEDAQISPTRTASVGRQAPAARPGGLRGSYRPDGHVRSKTGNDSRPFPEQVVNSTDGAKLQQLPIAVSSPRVPSRGSSKHAHTNSSSEHTQGHNPLLDKQCKSDMQSSNETASDSTDSASSEWASIAPVPTVSIVSANDLTSERDAREDRESWWRNVDRVTPRGTVPSQLDSRHASQAAQPIGPDVGGYLEKHAVRGLTLEQSRPGERQSKTSPNTPSKERDFLFNGAEDVETFMQKTKAKMGISRRQP